MLCLFKNTSPKLFAGINVCSCEKKLGKGGCTTWKSLNILCDVWIGNSGCYNYSDSVPVWAIQHKKHFNNMPICQSIWMFTYSYLSLNLNKIFIDKPWQHLRWETLKYISLQIISISGLNIHVFYPYYIEMIKHMLGKGVCWALE